MNNKVEALEVLEQLISDGKIHPFSDEETIALKRLAARERAWEGIGLLAKPLKTILTYIGFFIGIWLAFKTYLLDFLRGAL